MERKKFHFLKLAAITLGFAAVSVFGHNHAAASTIYQLTKGDTLYSLASKNDVTVSQLMQLNNLTSTTIYAGQFLTLPTTITIKKDDTLFSLATKYKTSVSQLKSINQLSSNKSDPGKKLVIPTTAIVKNGDTLFRIAKNYGLTVDELKSINGLTSNTIKSGQKLIVAKYGGVTAAPGRYDASRVRVGVTVKNDFTFHAEEPRRFIVQYTKNDAYFSRIEVLNANANVNEVKKNSKAYLKGNEITDFSTDRIAHPFYKNAEFFLHGSNTKTQTNIVVKEVDGKLIRFTIHYLNKEESEGIMPHMIDILKTVKVR
ncbi:LysM peptidoglycan-binding domain-containing protein [Bacillus sp. SA1-12]|uniref:LysM peptidoglycan-binding domain-containing protein n=1 Tax=Bacillus sp. SA1-12 TaxID=1455638 RepID=UPI000695F9D4|nr:LysM peptidoglycan-binding domain-containing protein [Bacillus sp. SA1-12]